MSKHAAGLLFIMAVFMAAAIYMHRKQRECEASGGTMTRYDGCVRR